ncbi:MAG TPA: deoxyribodipyrimidine photo-lyase, partial [Thiolinea sp.]|nr:deoxyribodipyrimidine photo-lyase [Thiolinea sp.]
MTLALVWLRQDLRLADNPAFFEACRSCQQVIPV